MTKFLEPRYEEFLLYNTSEVNRSVVSVDVFYIIGILLCFFEMKFSRDMFERDRYIL